MILKNTKKLKCPICETYNYKEETVYHQKRYYCKICYENKTKDSNDYKELINYICNIYEIDAPTGFMLSQIKKFKDQFNYTYKGIELTLDYFYNIKTNNTPDMEMGLGVVPYIYEEAKQFFIEKRNIKNNIQNIDIQDITSKVNVINIKKSDKKSDVEYKNIAIIDIAEI